jgi:hypothetical protein
MRICRIQSSSRKDKFNLQLAIVGADEPARRQLFSARPCFLLSFAPNSQQIREKQSAADALRISSLSAVFVFISRFPDWDSSFKAAAAWY